MARGYRARLQQLHGALRSELARLVYVVVFPLMLMVPTLGLTIIVFRVDDNLALCCGGEVGALQIQCGTLWTAGHTIFFDENHFLQFCGFVSSSILVAMYVATLVIEAVAWQERRKGRVMQPASLVPFWLRQVLLFCMLMANTGSLLMAMTTYGANRLYPSGCMPLPAVLHNWDPTNKTTLACVGMASILNILVFVWIFPAMTEVETTKDVPRLPDRMQLIPPVDIEPEDELVFHNTPSLKRVQRTRFLDGVSDGTNGVQPFSVTEENNNV